MNDQQTGEHEAGSRALALLVAIVVRPSFERCCSHGDEFFDTFYASLAERIPGIGAKFHGVDMHKQNSLVREGIGHLLDFAERDPNVRAELERLGRLHAHDDLDIAPDLYPAWVDTLLHAVAEFDPRYDEKLGDAWREAVRPGIELMIAAY